MDPHDLKEQFDLEDIIREFSQKDEDTDRLLREYFPETPRVHLPPMPVAEPISAAPTVCLEMPAEPAAVPQETAVFTPISQLEDEPESEILPSLVEEPEIDLLPQLTTDSQTVQMPALIPEIEEVPKVEDMPPLEETEPEAAAFSDAWEPQYEAPMGDYETREPIQFPKKNRTQQLREKLVAGPEKRFHDLTAAGLTGMRVGIFLQILLLAAAIASTAMLHFDRVSGDSLHALLFAQMIIIALSALAGCNRLLNGFGCLLRGQFSLSTLLVVTCAACLVDAYYCIGEQRMALSAPFCIEMLMSQLSAHQQRTTELSQMDTLRKAHQLHAIVKVHRYHQDLPGYVCVDGEPESFMHHYAAVGAPEKALRRYSLIAMFISAALGAFAGWRYAMTTGLQVFAVALLICMPATAHISMSRPAHILQKRLGHLGAVLCGWQGIRHAERNAVCPLSCQDLFPPETVKLNGVKFFGSIDHGWTTACAAALARANDSALLPLLEQLPRGRDGMNQLVQDLHVYEGGVSAVVSGVPAALGTADFMQRLDVEVPSSARINDAVYICINGELSAVFVVSYQRSKAAAAGLRNLCGWRSLTPVLVSSDFMLTPHFIREKLGVKIKRIQFLPFDARKQLQDTHPDANAPVIALTTNKELSAKAYAINGAWALRSAQSSGANIHMLSGSMGLILTALLIILGAPEMLTGTNTLLFMVAWMIPGWLYTEWTRWL